MVCVQIDLFSLGIQLLGQHFAEGLVPEQRHHVRRIAGAALGLQLPHQCAQGLGPVVAAPDVVGGSIQRVRHGQHIHDALDVLRAGRHISGVAALSVVEAVVIERRRGQMLFVPGLPQQTAANDRVALDAAEFFLQQAAAVGVDVYDRLFDRIEKAELRKEPISLVITDKGMTTGTPISHWL